MARTVTASVVPHLESLFEGGSVAALSDRQLLERYNAGGRTPAGEAAFAALVARHGPMVLALCRQLLGDVDHAEDTFQAVFLVLAQRARSLRDPDLLGNWLYGVALRTARCARHRIGRRERREGEAMKRPGTSPAAEPSAPPADHPVLDREQADAIHGEVARLPRAFRLPVVLCYFEGLTAEEAARRLRCPSGTIRSRLTRAREKLRRGLVRRGVALPAAALGVVLVPRPASASVSPLLCDTTTRAATAFAARHAAEAGGLSATAAALAREVLHSMLIHKLRLTALSLLLLAAVATGAGWLTRSLAMKEDDPVRAPAEKPPAEAEPASARMTVAGRVLDPSGQPVAGAVVDLIARPRVPWVGASEESDRYTLLGRSKSGADGAYRLDAPRTASIRVFEVVAVAAAPGYGLGWAALNPDAERPAADLKLLPEQPLRIRLVDVSGTPARGVEVRVLGVGRASGPGSYDGVSLGENPPQAAHTWPRPVVTDDQGKLTLNGIGRADATNRLHLNLAVRDPRYARQGLNVDPRRAAEGKEITVALEPARIIEGRVLAADTGRPIPNAVVSAAAHVRNEHANGIFTTKFRADGEGRFTMNPIASDRYTLGAFPTGDAPYLIQQDEFKWPKAAVRTTHDITVRRGVLIRGKVTEAGTGRPLEASSVQFLPVRGGDDVLSGWQAIVASRADGSFEIAVPAGKGHLLVFGPTGDYVLETIGSNRLYQDKPGGQRYHAHAIIPYEVKAGGPPHEVAAALRPGVTVKGRVEGPDGQTIDNGFLLTTLRIEAFNPSWRGDYQVPVRDGRFELHGLAPEGSTRIHILDPEHEWGASVDVSANQAGNGPTVRLRPCGTARARFVGPDGQPVAGHRPHFEFVATPGPNPYSLNPRDEGELKSDAELVANVDRKHYWNGPKTDADGKITLGSLIPGSLYRILDFSTVGDAAKGVQVRKEFSVKAGETLDLGDLRIDKPGGR